MNVANLELCKELYELGGWGLSENSDLSQRMLIYREYKHAKEVVLSDRLEYVSTNKGKPETSPYIYPAYDLGYLLRKLDEWDVQLFQANGKWCSQAASVFPEKADTPEDAVCKLAIELLKQGVLK